MSASTVDCALVPTPSAGLSTRRRQSTSAHRCRHKPSAHADFRVVRELSGLSLQVSQIPKVLGSRNSPVSAAAPSITNHMPFEAASVLQIGKGPQPHWRSWPRAPASMSRRSIARVLRPSPPSSALVLDGTSGLRSAEGEFPRSGLRPSLVAAPRCESGAGFRFPQIGNRGQVRTQPVTQDR